MSSFTGFSIEDLFNATPANGEETQEPKVEQLLSKLRTLQRGKRALEEEIKEITSIRDLLQKELATLQTESYKLEGIQQEKEGLCRNLQFQCEESEQQQIRQSKKSEEVLEQYRCEIQEFKLKHRKLRMKFENQLCQLIEQHKNLHSMFTPEMLPGEIQSAENTKSQLLSVEQLKSAQLRHLDNELEDVRKQKQLGTTAAGPQKQ